VIYGELLIGLPCTYQYCISDIALLIDELRGMAVGRYLLRDSLRYVRVHLSLTDERLLTVSRILLPPSDHYKTHEL